MNQEIQKFDLDFNEQELSAIKAVYAPDATDEEFKVFVAECRTRRLFPGRQVHFTKRKQKKWDADTRTYIETSKPTYITSIDSFRLIAQRTGLYVGQKPQKWVYLDAQGVPSIYSEIPLPEMKDGKLVGYRRPYAATAIILRKDFSEPMSVVARLDAYEQTYRTKEGEVRSGPVWAQRGPEQLAKCAEALALRKAFPEELYGLYTEEETSGGEVELQASIAPGQRPVALPPVPELGAEPPPPQAQPAATPTPEPPAKEAKVVPTVNGLITSLKKKRKANSKNHYHIMEIEGKHYECFDTKYFDIIVDTFKHGKKVMVSYTVNVVNNVEFRRATAVELVVGAPEPETKASEFTAKQESALVQVADALKFKNGVNDFLREEMRRVLKGGGTEKDFLEAVLPKTSTTSQEQTEEPPPEDLPHDSSQRSIW